MIQEIINIVWLLILFGLFWVIGAVGHELFHGLACYLQGSKFKISIWWNGLLPSMKCTSEGDLKDEDMFYYLGGVGIGSTFVLVSLLFYFIYIPLFITLFLVGIAHFFYGLFEGLFIRKMELKDYMIYHYLMYLLATALGIALIRNPIIDYIW